MTEHRIATLYRDALWTTEILPSLPRGQILPSLLAPTGQRRWQQALRTRSRGRALVAQAERTRTPFRSDVGGQLVDPEVLGTPEEPSRLQGQVDDAISRLTSYAGWEGNTEARTRFVEEVRQLLLPGPGRESWTPPLLPTVSEAPVEITRLRSGYRYCQGDTQFTIRTPQVDANLRRFYPEADDQDVGVITLLLYVQRSTSGSNWSPAGSYPGLVELYEAGETGILECFCGPLNHQDIVQGQVCTHARLGLDAELLRIHTHQEKWVGTWPKGMVPEIRRLAKRYDRILLLVNPPYSETEIARMTRVLRELADSPLARKVRLWTWTTLPDWPDIYRTAEEGRPGLLAPIMPLVRDLEIHEESVVSNYSSHPEPWTVALRYRSFTVCLSPE